MFQSKTGPGKTLSEKCEDCPADWLEGNKIRNRNMKDVWKQRLETRAISKRLKSFQMNRGHLKVEAAGTVSLEEVKGAQLSKKNCSAV